MGKWLKVVALLALGLVLFTALVEGGCGRGPKEVVTFPDPNLERAIREAIDKDEGPILASDLKALKSLGFSGINYLGIAAITDLSGLEHCTNLTDLSLTESQISDISPLTRLTKLEYLNLSSNQISDITPLSHLTRLERLDLSNNQIRDITPPSPTSPGWNR